MTRITWMILLLATSFYGCGGGGGDDGGDASNNNPSENEAPVANAGAAQTISEGDTVSLDGSGSSDSDGSIASYVWSEDGNELSTEVSFSKTDFTAGTHTLTLTITDNDGATDSDTVVITVLDSQSTSGLSNASLTGNYSFVGENTTLYDSTTEFAVWTHDYLFDGQGDGQFQEGLALISIYESEAIPDSYLIGASGSDTFTYNLSSNGLLTSSEGNFAVSPDANTIIGVGSVSETGESSGDIKILVKQGEGLSNASLSGTYTHLSIEPRYKPHMAKGILSFDGEGGCSHATLQEYVARRNDSTGEPELLDVTLESGTCTYSVLPNGVVTTNNDPNNHYTMNSETGLIVGTTPILFELFVKQSTGLSDASLNGSYHAVGKSIEVTASGYESWIWEGEFTFDGVGGCNYVGSLEQGVRRNSTTDEPELFTGDPDNDTCTYSLASNGTLTINGNDTYAVTSATDVIVGVSSFSSSESAGGYIESMVKKPD